MNPREVDLTRPLPYLWAHTRGGNHQSVPVRKVAAKEDRSLDPPAKIRGRALAADEEQHLWYPTTKKDP